MRAQTKAMVEIRRKREEARRNQTTALKRKEDENLEIEMPRTLKGSKISKPGKSFKVDLIHFKLKTVLGRGAFGKVKRE